MRKDAKRRKVPTTAKIRRCIIESYELLYGRGFTWGMRQLFSKRLANKYLKAKRLSRLRKGKEGEGKK